MSDLPIPAGPEALSVDWLTAAMRSTGALEPGVAVQGFDSVVLGEGKGFTGRVVRLTMEYDQETEAPPSLIAKFPPAAPEARAALHYYRVYEREVSFYRDLADAVVFRVPDSYYGDVDLETGECVLLLEDLAPAVPFDIIAGVPPQKAYQIVREMAAHHAQWWERDELDRFPWLRFFDAQAPGDQERYQAAMPVFQKKMRDEIAPGIIELGERIQDKITWIMGQIASSPTTFLHGDFHPNNLFLEESDDGSQLAVVDWQVCSRGRGTRDLMYFVVGALTPEHRVEHEQQLLATYHRALVGHGVRDYSLDDLMEGYRFALLSLMQFYTVVIAILDFEVNEEARAVRDLLSARWGGAILAHDPGALLPPE